MIEFNNTDVMGFPGAIRGMRQPYKSTDRSDSEHKFSGIKELVENSNPYLSETRYVGKGRYMYFVIGPKDHELAMKLCEAGPEHRKFLRMIHCQADIKAPLYWWKQFDTLKIGTVANSESTMHTIMKEEFKSDDFSFEDVPSYVIEDEIKKLNWFRNGYINGNSILKETYWNGLIEILPESYNQTRTVDLNYEVIRTAYHQRKNHKLGEWHKFCEWAEQLPYSEFITGKETE